MSSASRAIRSGIRSRHAFFETGSDIRTVQELLGHADVSTTMVYTHVLNRGGLGVRSPMNRRAARRNELGRAAAGCCRRSRGPDTRGAEPLVTYTISARIEAS